LFSAGDRVETRAIIRLPEQALKRIDNGTPGVITSIDEKGAKIRWTRTGDESYLTNDDIRFIDHAYAHTSYKEQGATNDREIIAVSVTGAKVFNREAAYVAASRARDNTEIVTEARDAMLKNAGKEVGKTTAVDFETPAEQLQPQARNIGEEQAPTQSQAPRRDRAREAPARPEPRKERGLDKQQERGNLLQF
jgi:ATP-dependent exoDNAse (exonuclease V) alpha subunit